MLLRIGLVVALLALTLSQVYSGPIAVKGKENVFKYSIKVGRDDESTQSFKQGLNINIGLTVRKKTDDSYFFTITDVEVRCHRNNAIKKETYAALESALKVPFEYNPKAEHGLTIYAPDKVDSEASNIKRGLVSIVHFYDADTKKVEKIANEGASGKCPLIGSRERKVNEEEIESNSFYSFDANCTAGRPHQYVKKHYVSSHGSFCEVENKISRNVNYRVTRSKDGSDKPKILVKGTEKLRLQSIFPNGLFNELAAHTTLELVTVKEATASEAPAGESGKSCLEVRVHSDKPHDHSAEQPELLKKAQEGFKMLNHCLNKLDNEDHLETQTVPEAVVFLTEVLKHLNKESLVSLYNSLDPALQQHFFQILALEPSHDAFDAVQDIYTDAWADQGDNIPSFFENLDHKGKGVDVKTVAKFPALVDKVDELDKTNTRLKNSIILAGSGIIYEHCIKNGKQDEACPTVEQMMTRIGSKDPENKDENMQVLKLKVIGNLQIDAGLPYIKQSIETKTNTHLVRSTATWSLLKLVRRSNKQVKEIANKLFFDRTEDHEIRIAAYLALAMSGSVGETQSAVQYLIDNHDNEDRQLVSYVVSSTNNLKNMKYPDGSKCRSFPELYRALESSVASVAKKLGPRDLFDSAVYTLNSKDSREKALVSVIAAKDDVIPRSVYIKLQDPLQSRSYSLHSVSDGFLYNNLVALKASYEAMKKQQKVPNEAIKTQLDAVFEKVAGKPADQYFAMTFTENVDGIDVSYERYSKPDELIQRIFSLVQSAEKYTRTFKKYNDLVVKSHTESGLKVKFMTGQSAVSSVEMPVFSIGEMSKSGIPLSLKYGYKFVSKTAYMAYVKVPESEFKYVTGKLGEKHINIPRNVTLTVMPKTSATFNHIVIRGKDDPLTGSASKDLFYRALTPVDGNLETWSDLAKLYRSDKKALDTHTHFHDYFGYGIEVSKSAGYVRPMPWKTPLTRMSPYYQELEHETKPYKYKVAVSKNTKPNAATVVNYEINILNGIKDDKYVMMISSLITNPVDPAAKSIRFSAGKSVDTKNLDKRNVLISYENFVKKIFLRSSMEISLPEDKTPVPSVTKATEAWKSVYADQKIKVNGKFKFTPTTRTEFSPEDVNDLINGFTDEVDATGEAEIFRTEEQVNLFNSKENSVDSVLTENLYSMLIGKAQAHPGCSLKTWDALLKFHGVKGSVKLNKPLPEPIASIRRRIRNLLVAMHYLDMTSDYESKAPEGTLTFYVNSTVDSQRTDITIQDPQGTQKFRGIKSCVLPYMRPSLSPVKVFQSNTLNKPVCSIVAEPGRNEIETFSRRDIMTDDLADGCDYLLTSNCRGLKNFAITYNKKDQSYKILYDNINEIIVQKDAILFNNEKKAEADGVTMVAETTIGRYRGLMGIILPNKIEFIREVDSPNAYIRASRMFRGRLCGLCGSNDGNSASDDVSSLSEFSVSGTCAAA